MAAVFRRKVKENAQLVCTIEGCDHEHYGHGYCEAHYKRWKRWGDPLKGKPVRPRTPGHRECTVEGCNRKHLAKGYCAPHYYRWKKHGDPEVVMLEHTGEFRTNRYGYRTRHKTVDGMRTTEREHRVVMEQLLGRPLLPNEEVHHLNTLAHDNRVDGPLDGELKSGNLQLWYKPQPAGGRVGDLIGYVTDFHLAAALKRAVAAGRTDEILSVLFESWEPEKAETVGG